MGIIIHNKKLKPEHYLLSISLPGHQFEPAPGQFCMLSCGPTTDPLLRRPLSIHDYFPQKGKIPPDWISCIVWWAPGQDYCRL